MAGKKKYGTVSSHLHSVIGESAIINSNLELSQNALKRADNIFVSNNLYTNKRMGTYVVEGIDSKVTKSMMFEFFKNKDENYTIRINLLVASDDSKSIEMRVIKNERYSKKLIWIDESTNAGTKIKNDVVSVLTADDFKWDLYNYVSINESVYIATRGQSWMLHIIKEGDAFSFEMLNVVPPLIKVEADTVSTAAALAVQDKLFATTAEAEKWIVKVVGTQTETDDDGEPIGEFVSTQTIRYTEGGSNTYSLKAVAPNTTDYALPPGVYLSQWHSGNYPNAVGITNNRLEFSGSKLFTNKRWQSIPNKFDSFAYVGQGQEGASLAYEDSLNTDQEIIGTINQQGATLYFTNYQTIFVSAQGATNLSNFGAHNICRPIVFADKVFGVSNENQLWMWDFLGDVQGGWRGINLTEAKNIDLLNGTIKRIVGIKHNSRKNTYTPEGSVSQQIDADLIFILIDDRIVCLTLSGAGDINVNGTWYIENSSIMDISGNYERLQATALSNEGAALLEFDSRKYNDFEDGDVDLSFISRHNTGTNAIATPKYASNDDSSVPIQTAGIYQQGVNAGVLMSGQLDYSYRYFMDSSYSGLGALSDYPVPNNDDGANETDHIVLMKITQLGIEIVAKITASVDAVGRPSPPNGGYDANSNSGVSVYNIGIRQIGSNYIRNIGKVNGTAIQTTTGTSTPTGEEDKGGGGRYSTYFTRSRSVSLSQYFTIAANKTSDEEYVITINFEDVGAVEQYTFEFDLAIVNTDLDVVDESITKLFYATIQNITTTGYTAGLTAAKSVDIDSIDDTDKSNYSTYTDIMTDAIDAYTLDGEEFVNINRAVAFTPVKKLINVVIEPVVPTVAYNSYKQQHYAITPSQYVNGKLVVINGSNIDLKLRGNVVSKLVAYKPMSVPINNATPFAGVHRVVYSIIVNRTIQQNYYRTDYIVIEHKDDSDMILNNFITDYYK